MQLPLVKRVFESRLAQNIGSLTVLQAASYLIPLVTLPYLTRVLGPTEWGEAAWAQVIVAYFITLTDWGFSWSGVRRVSQFRSNPTQFSAIVLSSWAIQWALWIISTALLFGTFVMMSASPQLWAYAVFGCGIVLANVLLPPWIYLGIERIRDLAFLQMVARLAALPLVIFLVRTPQDAPLVLAANAIPNIIVAVFGVVWFKRTVTMDWQLPTMDSLTEEFRSSTSVFLSRLSIVLYTNLTPSILGMLTNPAAVGHYVLADKLRLAAQSLLSPISTALYPRMSFLFAHDRTKAGQLLARSAKAVILLALIVSIALSVSADPIINLVAGEGFEEAVVILHIMSPIIIVVTLSNILGLQIMLPAQRTRAFNSILTTAGLLSLAFITPLVTWQGAPGAAINGLLVETGIALVMALYVYRNRGVIFNEN